MGRIKKLEITEAPDRKTVSLLGYASNIVNLWGVNTDRSTWTNQGIAILQHNGHDTANVVDFQLWLGPWYTGMDNCDIPNPSGDYF